MRKILIIDDHDIDRQLIRSLLGCDDAMIEATSVRREGPEADRIECGLLDQRLPDGAGIERGAVQPQPRGRELWLVKARPPVASIELT
ncbi:MAG TPA: hypothetical protein VG963_22950 [Polyangiaceae bacterium]|nr:hypothetical protein [Polyangiaceae bacterium]